MDTFQLTERKKMVMQLKEEKGITNQKARVVAAIDYSGSMSSLYGTGTVQNVIERLLPVGLGFDDDGEIDTFIFHDDSIRLPEAITRKNVDGYVNNKILGKYHMGGTDYSKCIRAITKEFGNPKKTGLFSSGVNPVDIPTYVMFFTDGESGNRGECEKSIIEASEHSIFFQFVGIGNESFQFLQKLDALKGRKLDNANFFKINDLNKISDSDLYKNLMVEFPGWIPQAKKAGMLNS